MTTKEGILVDFRFVARAVVVLAAALVASAALGQSAPASPASAWVPPSASPVLPQRPPRMGAGVEDAAYVGSLQGIYAASEAIMAARFTQFTSDAKALQASHAIVLSVLLQTKSPDALVSCVKSHQAAENTALATSLRQDVALAKANLGRQRTVVVGTLRVAYPGDFVRAQALEAQYTTLAGNSVVMAELLIRVNKLQ